LLQQSFGLKAEMAIFAYNNVIYYIDAHDHCYRYKSFSDGKIFFARLNVAGRMVMDKYNPCGPVTDGFSENLPGMDHALEKRTDKIASVKKRSGKQF